MAFGDLTTLAEVKAWLQTAPGAFPSADDALLSRLVTAASQYIQTWLGRPIAQADYLEIRDGTGGTVLPLAVTPVSAILSLTIDGVAIPPSAGSTAAGYGFTATQLYLRGHCFTRRAGNVAIAYTAGYATIPPDIAQACIELVALRYRERTRIGEVSKHIGSDTVTYSQSDMSAAIATLLQRYRPVAPLAAAPPMLAPTESDSALIAAAL